MPLKKVICSSHFKAISTFISAPGDHIAIVPNSRWADELKSKLMTEAMTRVFIGGRVRTIRDHLKSLHNVSPIISHPMQLHLLRRVMQDSRMKYFKRISFGVASACLGTISKLKKNGISSSELDEILSTRGGEKEFDLLTAYKGYETMLAERAWHDEDDLYKAGTPDGHKYHLIGFDCVMPFMEKIFPDAVCYIAEMTEVAEPGVFAVNSPSLEASFISRKISALLSEGVPQEKIGVFCKTGHPFVAELASHFSTENQFRPLSSRMMFDIVRHDDLPDVATLSQFVSASQKVLESVYEQFKESLRHLPELSSRSLSYIESFNRTFKELSFEFRELGQDGDLTRQEFAEILCEQLKASPLWPTDVPFKFVPFEDAGLYDLSASFIPCMNDGYLPAPKETLRFFTELDTLSPSPDERIAAIFPSAEADIKRDLNAFRAAASSSAVITYHRYNSLGKESVRSPFIIRYPHTEIDQPILPPVKMPNTCGSNISSDKALTLLKEQFKERSFSATKLEEYGNCPFTYFCRHVLGIEAPDEETPEVQPKDRGTLIHEVLEVFFKEHGPLFLNALRDGTLTKEIERTIKEVTEAVFEENKDDITNKYHPDMVSYLKERSVKLVTAVIMNELVFMSVSTQRPVECEFGFDEELFEGIRMTGKIDRIDADNESFTIIDYKTGGISSVKSGIKEGTELQVPIYTEMAARHLKKEPAAAFLYSVKEKKRKSGIIRKDLKDNVLGKGVATRLSVTKEEWDDLIELGLATAKSYVEKIRCGQFEGTPKECASYCDWKDVCRWS